MNKTALKIFLCFTIISAAIAVILLMINFFGFAFIGSDVPSDLVVDSPKQILSEISMTLTKTEKGFSLADPSILPADHWCILIDENGNILWSQNKPNDIPEHYSINDIAKMTRWFLNDYPVYVRAEDYGLLVLGTPKNSVGKYEITYSMEWFATLPQRLIGILAVNLLLAAALAFIIGIALYKRLCVLMNGINDLRQEKRVKLRENGIFKDLAKNINETSAAIQRKNAELRVRDNARSNWISGISHDIRTPLAILMGNSEALESSAELSKENQKKAHAITTQSMKIKKLIEDLNLISSLEYDMQPAQKKPVRLCSFLRQIVSNIINSGLADQCNIQLDLHDEKTTLLADEFLLERAIFNLINNSITHNKNGCNITIQSFTNDNAATIVLSDDGCGVPESVLDNISEIPKSAHGLGLPMAYKIISVHGGKMTARNENGFIVTIQLPVAR